MKIGPIVLRLRLANTHFGNNIGGVVELNTAMNYSIIGDAAFVIPLNEEPRDNVDELGINQRLVERFGVLVVLRTDTTAKEKMGIGAYDQLHDIRAELVRELVGLDLGYESTVRYAGGRLIDFNNAWMWYQYEFEFDSRVMSDEDGFGEIQSRTVDDRAQWSQLDYLDDIYTQYVLVPSLRWDEVAERVIGEGNHLPQETALMDAEQYVDLSQPYTGGYDSFAFAWGYDRYRVNK